MPEGDDLAVSLFFLSLALPAFGLEAVKAETIPRRVMFAILAVACLLTALLWIQIKQIWPPFAVTITSLSTNPVAWFAVLMFILGVFAFHRPRKASKQDISTKVIELGSPKIEVCFQSGAPYETSDIQAQRVLSTVKIGIKNSGGGAIANCVVFIDKIAPEPSPFFGGLPMILEGGGFAVRHDDPEKLINIAGYWDHAGKYRFYAPHGAFAESYNYIDANISRKIVIRIEATGCSKRSLFDIWVDQSKMIRLKYIGDAA